MFFTLTDVGTNYSSLRIFSTASASTAYLFSYMIDRVVTIFCCLCASSIRARCVLCFMSSAIPRLWTRDLGMRHRGQGQFPRLRIEAMRTLMAKLVGVGEGEKSDVPGSLFRVVRRVSKDSWVEAPGDPIRAYNHDTMLISFQEFIIKQNFPLRVKRFPVAVSHKHLVRTPASCVLGSKIFE